MGKLREPLMECSLPAALDAMGERWSFMILRAAFNGLHHFEEFQSELGIARNILANRLARLVEHGILEREPMPDDRRKIQYRLTEKGGALLPTMIALRQWGERWETCVPAFPVLVDNRDLRPIGPIEVHAHDGRVLHMGDLHWALPEDIAGDDGEPVLKAGGMNHPAPAPGVLTPIAFRYWPHIARRLAQPLFVLDQGDPHIAFAVFAVTDPRRDRDLRFGQ